MFHQSVAPKCVFVSINPAFIYSITVSCFAIKVASVFLCSFVAEHCKKKKTRVFCQLCLRMRTWGLTFPAVELIPVYLRSLVWLAYDELNFHLLSDNLENEISLHCCHLDKQNTLRMLFCYSFCYVRLHKCKLKSCHFRQN